ncbi:MAG: hypothetical protein HBSAPP04_21210 [Ignavibacteriaceae bacterium]|nr:MAG: lipopolysaccharide heptosyltransferase family protein [Chlorobiota bacterium]GJQ33282.1 MAG: hypothetical protein HBSAPP04_21210 [Ignavibacteriaceae bacterium]
MKKAEIFFKNLFLQWVLLRGRRKKHNGNIALKPGDRIACIRLNRIGDALVVTPLLHKLKENTGCSITVIADRHNHFVFRNNPDIDETIIFEKGSKGTKSLIRRLNEGNFKVFLDLHDDVSVTVSFIISKLKISRVAGLERGNSSLFTDTVPRLDPTKHHVIERSLKIAELFTDGDGKPITFLGDDVVIKYYPTADNIEVVGRYFESKFPEKKFVVGINISAGSMARYWGTRNFRDLIVFLKTRGLEYLLLCSTRDINLALEIDPYSERTYYTPDFGEFAAMIGKIDLLFSPDTATVHLASLHGVPVFGLYVKFDTDDIIWYPYNTRYEAVVTKEPTLKDMRFAKVIEKFEPFLKNELELYENTGL